MTTESVSGDAGADLGPARRLPRPTSRRGRAVTRRRAAEPTPATPGAATATTGGGPAVSAPRPPGRRGSDVRRRRQVVLAGMGVLTIAGVALAVGGLSAVRNSTAGRYQRALGPTEPGYQASVVPTPTMGLLLRTGDDRLAGATVLALEPGDAGGSVALVPAATVVRDAGGFEVTLDALYAERGAEVAAQALGEALTVEIDDAVEIADATWAHLVEPVGPVTVRVEDPVADWPEGDVVLQPGDVGRFLAARGDGEADLVRVERQRAFWDAWLPLVRQAGEGALPGEVDTGIGRFVRAIAAGEGAASAIPVGREDAADGVRYRPDSLRLGEFLSVTIPYPTSPAPGIRIRVRLLNGTDDPGLTERAARALVAGGAEVAVVGNASSFSLADTRLVYRGPPQANQARWLEAALGFGRSEPAGTRQDGEVAADDDIDVTVILGQDAGDTLGREQTSD